MPSWVWIVVAVVLLVAVLLLVGLQRSRRRRVTLREPEQAEKPKPTAGSYATGSSISFSAGTAVEDGPKTQEPPAAIPEPPTPTPDTASRAVAEATTAAPAEQRIPTVPDTVPVDWERTETDGQPGVGDDASVPRDSVRQPIIDVPLPAPPVFAPVDRPAVREPVPALPADLELADDTGIEPAEGRLSRLRGRLSRSQSVFGKSLLGLLGGGDLDEDSWTDIEDTLLMADLGAAAAAEITGTLRRAVAARGTVTATEAKALLREVLIDALDPSMARDVRALPHDGRPSVVLVVGVNGTGKTTTTGKLARVLVAQGHTVVLGAADTFRAAAADQLATWAERAGAQVVRGSAGADPAAVAFDAVKQGIERKADAVIVDTAGRLHTKTGLMDELGKVKRVIEKQAEVDEILLVLDATTGQNGMIQAKVFAEVVDITGIVLTKLDGTAKGGIVVAVQRALGVPVKLVGLGEGADDLAPFEPAAFVDALLGD